MQITGFEIVRVRVPLLPPYVLSQGEWDAFTNLPIRLHADAGRYGIPECAVLSLIGEISTRTALGYDDVREGGGGIRVSDVDGPGIAEDLDRTLRIELNPCYRDRLRDRSSPESHPSRASIEGG